MSFALLGPIIGGITSAVGDAVNSANQPGQPAQTMVDINLQSDPLNVAIALDALAQLGDTSGVEFLLQKASPLQQQIDAINRSPYLSNTNKQAAIGYLKASWEGVSLPAAALGTATQAYKMARSYIGLPDQPLGVNDRLQWEKNAAAKIEQIKNSGAGEARAQAIQDMAEIAGSIGGLETGKGSVSRDYLARQIERDATLAREQALAQANAGGYNPGRALGEIDKARLEAMQDTPLKALELDIARLTSLGDYLQQGTTNSQNATQIRNQGALSGAQIAANQISAADAARVNAAKDNTTPGGDLLGGLGSTLTLAGLLAPSKPGVT